MHLSSLLFLFFSFSSSGIVPSSTKEYRYLIFWLSNFICRLTNRQLTTPVYLISLIILFYFIRGEHWVFIVLALVTDFYGRLLRSFKLIAKYETTMLHFQ